MEANRTKRQIMQDQVSDMHLDYVTRDGIKPLEDCIRTLNREMGEVQGQLIWIKYLMGATFLAALAQIILPLLAP